jgi:hypothetical protein
MLDRKRMFHFLYSSVRHIFRSNKYLAIYAIGCRRNTCISYYCLIVANIGKLSDFIETPQ